MRTGAQERERRYHAMGDSSLMELVHWMGVVLATPAAAVVLHASWRTLDRHRALRAQRTIETDQEESR